MQKMKAYFKKFYDYRFLLKQLIIKGIKLKYRRSYLGILWSLIEPILTMLVLTLIFGTLLGRGDKYFPIYVLSGRLLYSYFSTGTKAAMRSIRGNAAMIKKVYVPKYLYPMSSCMYTYIIFLISLVDLIGAMVVMRMEITPYIFLVVIPISLLFFLTFGVGMILATINVFFRDLEYIWDVVMMLIMYTCAIFYKIDSFIGKASYIVFKMNPLYALIKSFRECLYGSPMNFHWLLYAACFSFGTCILGAWMFNKMQDRFILHI
jgi:ABC-2 type transport system permease protein